MDQAQKDFAWALRKDDDDTLYSLAEELYALGLTNQAQRTYLKLLDRYPQEDELRTALAEIAIDNGDNDEAFPTYPKFNPARRLTCSRCWCKPTSTKPRSNLKLRRPS